MVYATFGCFCEWGKYDRTRITKSYDHKGIPFFFNFVFLYFVYFIMTIIYALMVLLITHLVITVTTLRVDILITLDLVYNNLQLHTHIKGL